MNKKLLNYRVIIEKEVNRDRVFYVAYVPTLGISDFGKTVDEAIKNTKKAIELYLQEDLKVSTAVPRVDNEEFFITNTKVKIAAA